ncbi:YHYH protein [Aurantibacter sp.]|uniref:YHYH protein n=1 Tax=Aurantibacter sp. TaxID=2807103 RepID=UPI00326557DA
MNSPIFKFPFQISAMLFIIFLSFTSCSDDDTNTEGDEEIADDDTGDDTSTVSVDASYFTADNVTITTVPCTLSDGTETDCYQIVTSSAPADHDMGPWCPDNISDSAEAGGIWLENGEVYDVDGAFVENLATFYNDNNWQMYDANGDIYITDTQEDCENAANPNVGSEYENFCVECLPSYITDLSQTWLIPISPVLQDNAVLFSTGPGGAGNTAPSTRGVALNGIEFSAPAPVDNILGAYTLAPFDDAGGHINVNQGYHYHAATMGVAERHVIVQEDGHSSLIGYALDGYGIYELEDADGNVPTDLDELRGHTDDIRGYHYHVDEAGNNNFINGLKGAYAI